MLPLKCKKYLRVVWTEPSFSLSLKTGNSYPNTVRPTSNLKRAIQQELLRTWALLIQLYQLSSRQKKCLNVQLQSLKILRLPSSLTKQVCLAKADLQTGASRNQKTTASSVKIRQAFSWPTVIAQRRDSKREASSFKVTTALGLHRRHRSLSKR